jgi:hypothetical protein
MIRRSRYKGTAQAFRAKTADEEAFLGVAQKTLRPIGEAAVGDLKFVAGFVAGDDVEKTLV